MLSDRLGRIEALLERHEAHPEDPNVFRELRGLVAAEYDSDVAFQADATDLLLLARIAVHAERFEQVMIDVLDHMHSCPGALSAAT